MTAPREGKCRYCGNVLLGDRREEDCVSKPLSAEERARKIENHLDKIQWTPYAHGVLVAALVAYGEICEDLGFKKGFGFDEKGWRVRQAEEEGYRRGIEEAAEICQIEAKESRNPMALILAERIMTLSSDDKK